MVSNEGWRETFALARRFGYGTAIVMDDVVRDAFRQAGAPPWLLAMVQDQWQRRWLRPVFRWAFRRFGVSVEHRNLGPSPTRYVRVQDRIVRYVIFDVVKAEIRVGRAGEPTQPVDWAARVKAKGLW